MAKLELGGPSDHKDWVELMGDSYESRDFKAGPPFNFGHAMEVDGPWANVQDHKNLPLKIGYHDRSMQQLAWIHGQSDKPPTASIDHQTVDKDLLGFGPGFGNGPAFAGEAGRGAYEHKLHFEGADSGYAYDYGYKGSGVYGREKQGKFTNEWVSTVESSYHLAGKSSIYELHSLSILVAANQELYVNEATEAWSPAVSSYIGGVGSPWANAWSTAVDEEYAACKATFKGDAITFYGLDKKDKGVTNANGLGDILGPQSYKQHPVEHLFADGVKTDFEKTFILDGWAQGGISYLRCMDLQAMISALAGAVREMNDRLILLEKMHAVNGEPPGEIRHTSNGLYLAGGNNFVEDPAGIAGEPLYEAEGSNPNDGLSYG